MKRKVPKMAIKPGEKFNPEIHIDRRVGLADRRSPEQQKPHFAEGGHGWSAVGTTPLFYRKNPATGEFITDPKTGKKKSFADQRISPLADRRKKKG